MAGRFRPEIKGGGDHQFPKFETYRQQIDGKNRSPTYTIANSYAALLGTTTLRITRNVRYEDYKQFKASVHLITFGDETDPTQRVGKRKPGTTGQRNP